VPIFDQGYQHWSGHLSNHAWRWLAISRHGVRTGLKLPRLKRTLFIAWLPALGLAVFLCAWGLMERKAELVSGLQPALQIFGPEIMAEPRQIRVEVWTIAYSYFMNVELFLSMVLILLVGPNLISQDLRFNALPLYFSRPLRRFDYFLGKLGVIGVFLGLVTVAPAVIAYILGILFSLDFTILGDTLPILLGAIFYGLLIVISAGTLILALSSLARNSRYIAILWAAIWFLTYTVSGILIEIEHESRNRDASMSYGNPYQGGSLEEWQQAMERAQRQAVEREKREWRGLISYTANLQRVGRKLLGTNAAWVSLAERLPPERQMILRTKNMDSAYPAYWSFAVLVGLFGLSVCILHFRIRSLDRLK
jgi:ABC-2 type transport system permease protein